MNLYKHFEEDGKHMLNMRGVPMNLNHLVNLEVIGWVDKEQWYDI
jgi:hypothetical protein